MPKQMKLFVKEDLTTIDHDTGVSLVDTRKTLSSSKVFKVISLFCGCGGMDLGFRGGFEIFGEKYELNPYEIVFSNDIVAKACETYELNLRHSPVCADIKDIALTSLPEADIIIGGFPCQDFSLAGKRRGLSAERGQLYLEMKKVIDYCKPLAFVAENVDGIRLSSLGSTSALEIILNDFRSSGYIVKYRIMNAADYGVPQTRTRVIIIGVRADSCSAIYYPMPVRGSNTENQWMTSKEAIDDLWGRLGDTSIANHSNADYSKAKFYKGKKMQGNYCIAADKPSNTIRSEHHGNIEGHYNTTNPNEPDNPDYWRRLSVRECARIQTFPDDFVFPCSSSDSYKQIGNAVPPVLGWHVARALYYSLTQNDKP